jgi:hypothetical protein
MMQQTVNSRMGNELAIEDTLEDDGTILSLPKGQRTIVIW